MAPSVKPTARLSERPFHSGRGASLSAAISGVERSSGGNLARPSRKSACWTAAGAPSRLPADRGPCVVASSDRGSIVDAASAPCRVRRRVRLRAGPQIRRGDPLNLSISISGGKATNQDSPSNGERSGNSSSRQSLVSIASELWPAEADAPDATPSKLTWKGTSERVIAPCVAESPRAATVFGESGCLGVQPKVGGKLHLKPNSGTRPIANKYHEGKVKSTLERELKRPRNRWEGNACSRTGPRRVQGDRVEHRVPSAPIAGRRCAEVLRAPALSAARAGQVRRSADEEHASGR